MRADQLQFLSELFLIQRIGKLRDTVVSGRHHAQSLTLIRDRQ